jgi:hypothetical protein
MFAGVLVSLNRFCMILFGQSQAKNWDDQLLFPFGLCCRLCQCWDQRFAN